jgi:hypothetical protein
MTYGESYLQPCFDEAEDTDEKGFSSQSPEYHGSNRCRTPGKYFPVVNVPASQLSQPLAVKAVYEHWCETGKIAMVETRFPRQKFRHCNSDILLAAYRFGLEESSGQCADFRDAVIDTLAELLDVTQEFIYNRNFFKAIMNVPNSSL